MNTRHYIVTFFVLGVLLPLPVFGANLPVPHSAQAPQGSWQTQPWKDSCEETSIAMVDYYYRGLSNLSGDIAVNEILKQNRLMDRLYGPSLDENAEKIAGLANTYMSWEAHVVTHPTLGQIKREIDLGQPVIVPAHATELRNPYFGSDRLDYHVFVISGYDDITQEFITQEPGTWRGHNLRYPYTTVMKAMHDFTVRGETQHNTPRAVFTRKNLLETADTDADNDGLTKEQELLYHTYPWSADTDSDGFSDGLEVERKYSPTVNEFILSDGALVRASGHRAVYFISHGYRRHVASPEVFWRHGWQRNDIHVVSERYLNNLPTGTQLQ